MKYSLKYFAAAAALLALVISGSLVSSRFWGDKPERSAAGVTLVYVPGMTAAEFARANALPAEVAEAAFGARERLDLFHGELTEDGLKASVERELAVYNERASKNWRKIAAKFAMWLAFLAVVFPLLRRGLLTGSLRNWFYFASALIFGVALGADPSPMGTVKDAIVLYGGSGVVFKPRLAAFGVFLLLVVAANKFICSWGCQLGVLQDLLFRFGRGGGLRRYKPPFFVMNTIRVLALAAVTVYAFNGVDIIGLVDPFKIYSPLAVSLTGWVFITLLLAASLFVYRPWCHLFCPFGLAGWLAEKISVYRVTVNYDKCVACGACERACPSTVMGAILKRDRVIPDCFSCGDCLAACPSGAVTFSAARRLLPPPGKLDKIS